MKQRRIRVLCLQETRWKGCKAKEIGDDIKLFYHGLAMKNSGVAIAVAPPLKDHVSSVTRIRKWQLALADAGLKLNTKKTEVMSSTEEDYQVFDVSGTAFAQAKEFQYLGSYLNADGTVDAAVRGRIKCAWLKWRESTGILCDRRCSRVLKGKIYRRVVRPTLMYGSECWPLSKTHERMLNTVEMRMLRWVRGLTRCDRVPNEDIRTIMQTAPIQLKVRAQRLRWNGHVMRRPSPHPSRQAMEMNVTGKRSRERQHQFPFLSISLY
ncbi:hypothetical protein ANCCEY_08865 [Ancylostoma ceylanicum]|uniref:Reverse transcriptase domain-containing protein n=1 Tax=Ancylostoma ceylanicum TaxID=53326 RepID=A0A0D6LIZ7_9BILA|nr:hypothetical protein ANCCEY_08865 [Ancylostoma ceylanicum]